MTIHKAVLMAGGLGTRMRPNLASPINKHLVPVGGKPLIEWPLRLLSNTGIKNVLVLINGAHPEQILETVGTGEEFGLDVFYKYTPETHGPNVGKHLVSAQTWVGEDEFVLMLGDSVYLIDTLPNIKNISAPHVWTLRINEVPDPDPSKYALVPDINNQVQTGAWLLDNSIFTVISDLESEQAPEIRIRTIINRLTALSTTILPPNSFIDCGTPDAIKFVEEYVG